MFLKQVLQQEYIDMDSASAFRDFADILHKMICKAIKNGYKSIVFVCIGTDRSTGDSLGPLIGYKVGGLKYKNIFVYGNLENPVHAKNLDDVMMQVNERYDKPFIIAIDACLGRMDHIGYINVGEGSIRPGSGVNKELVPVGDMYITGIVNFSGFMDFLILQNTRLNIVMKMADIISMGIKYVIWKISNDSEIVSIFHNT